MTDENPALRPRRALSATAGRPEGRGDPGASAILVRAFDASAVEAPDALTHGFHSYPARMHRSIAREVIAAMSEPGDVVLDPFTGSGTVPVEAMVAGRRVVGIDMSPLALRIAEVKTRRTSEDERARFRETAREVAERSTARVRGRVYVRAPLPPSETRWYAPHVLKELGGLLEEIHTVPDAADLAALEMVLSSLVVKLSRQQADTAEREAPKRIRKGLATELFARKAEELVERWAALAAALPEHGFVPKLIEGDARSLARLVSPGTRPHLVLTSPPYVGTYDYVDHHARRYPWLGLDPRRFANREIGARRASKSADALARWDDELGSALAAIASVRRRGTSIVLLVGDGEVAGRRVPADTQLKALAPRVGLELVATATVRRKPPRGGPRGEHLFLLA